MGSGDRVARSRSRRASSTGLGWQDGATSFNVAGLGSGALEERHQVWTADKCGLDMQPKATRAPMNSIEKYEALIDLLTTAPPGL